MLSYKVSDERAKVLVAFDKGKWLKENPQQKQKTTASALYVRRKAASIDLQKVRGFDVLLSAAIASSKGKWGRYNTEKRKRKSSERNETIKTI